jgi:hypothetical protein
MNQQHQYPPPVYVVQQAAPPSTVLPAIVNLFFPPFGQLAQGRVLAFFAWLFVIFITAIVIGIIGFFTGGIGLLLGVVAGPLLYLICILDAVFYKG